MTALLAVARASRQPEVWPTWAGSPDLSAVLAFVMGSAACGARETAPGRQHHPEPGRSTTTRRAFQPRRVGYDPPTGFAKQPVPLPATAARNTNLANQQVAPPPVALVGTDAYVSTGRALQVVDAASGATLAEVKARHRVLHPPTSSGFAGGGPAPPVVATVGHGRVVVVGYVVPLGGHGITQASVGLELDLVPTKSNRLERSVTVPLVSGPPSALVAQPTVTVIGVGNAVVVAAVGDREDGVRDRGRRPGLGEATVARPGLPGGCPGCRPSGGKRRCQGIFAPRRLPGRADTLHLAALSLRSGRPAWQAPAGLSGVTIWPSGSRAVVVSGQDFNSGQLFLSLVAAATGKTRTTLSHGAGTTAGSSLGFSCTFDRWATDVCAAGSGPNAVAFGMDATSGKVLWQLPDKASNRVAPAVTTTWHGAVYGTTSSGPVILDARSGADRNDSPGIAPVLVDAYVGVGPTSSGLAAYPADRGPRAASSETGT